MSTLYISDLDGTLLDGNAEIPGSAKDELNRMIEAGLHFTVATARTAASCSIILADLRLQIPAILMNGVSIYDTRERQYIKKSPLEPRVSHQIIGLLRRHNLDGFMYHLGERDMVTYYESLQCRHMFNFYDERVRRYYKSFIKTPDLIQNADENVIYFTILESEERLRPLYNDLLAVDGAEAAFYHDVYGEKPWIVEVFSKNASKYNAALWLKERYGYSRLVAFGDNLNDLPLFAACDESYAVSNARDEVKAAATGIIGSNLDGGVVEFLRGIAKR